MKKSQLRHIIREILEDDSDEFKRQPGSMADTLWKANRKKWDKESTPSEAENLKIQADLKRWIKHSMDGGDSEADILSVLEEYAKTIISKIK
tara:strand:+ start:2649 stop:2924 length:276 start_codon:yes stop_codon:yes gene_type:complete